MSSINMFALSGRLAHDPELITKASGKQVLRFAIAAHDRRLGKDGNLIDDANYFRCMAFGKMASAVAPKLRRGMFVMVSGKMRSIVRYDKDTKARRDDYELVVDTISAPLSPNENPPARDCAAGSACEQGMPL